MNTIKIFLTAILLTIGTSTASFADGGHICKKACSMLEMQSQLDNLLMVSTNKITGLSGTVNFTIRLNENGKIEVISINGDVEDVVNRVEKVLKRSQLNIPQLKSGKAYRIHIDYDSTGEKTDEIA